jgi:tRNA pseudouridine13 synthase
MKFRQSTQTFVVEEVPLFEPSGRGDHVYIWTRRSGMSTPFLLKQLQRALRLGEVDLGCAGHKDRDALALQTISLPGRLERRAIQVLEGMGVEVLDARRHGHKLRTGKLAGNRFTVTVELDLPGDLEALEARCGMAEREGFPNAFGPQRFADGSAVEEGRRGFLGIRSRGPFRASRFAVSVFQSLLFNDVLELRQRRGLYPQPVPGDLMKKHETGGEFVALEVDETLRARGAALEISPTGPLFGGKMPRPEGKAWALENEILGRHGLAPAQVAAARAPGARRFLRVPTGSMDLRTEDQRVFLGFLLPPGSYASVLLAHLGIEVVPPQRPSSD